MSPGSESKDTHFTVDVLCYLSEMRGKSIANKHILVRSMHKARKKKCFRPLLIITWSVTNDVEMCASS